MGLVKRDLAKQGLMKSGLAKLGICRNLVKVAALAVIATSSLIASDLSIEIGNAVAAAGSGGTKGVTKVKNAVFSVRTRGCANVTDVRFSGQAFTDGSVSELMFTGGVPGAFAVSLQSRTTGPWLAVVTAECLGATAGMLLPVETSGAYNRTAARFFTHAPTEAEVMEMWKALKGTKQ